jgi:hypothetical protein
MTFAEWLWVFRLSRRHSNPSGTFRLRCRPIVRFPFSSTVYTAQRAGFARSTIVFETHIMIFASIETSFLSRDSPGRKTGRTGPPHTE